MSVWVEHPPRPVFYTRCVFFFGVKCIPFPGTGCVKAAGRSNLNPEMSVLARGRGGGVAAGRKRTARPVSLQCGSSYHLQATQWAGSSGVAVRGSWRENISAMGGGRPQSCLAPMVSSWCGVPASAPHCHPPSPPRLGTPARPVGKQETRRAINTTVSTLTLRGNFHQEGPRMLCWGRPLCLTPSCPLRPPPHPHKSTMPGSIQCLQTQPCKTILTVPMH